MKGIFFGMLFEIFFVSLLIKIEMMAKNYFYTLIALVFFCSFSLVHTRGWRRGARRTLGTSRLACVAGERACCGFFSGGCGAQHVAQLPMCGQIVLVLNAACGRARPWVSRRVWCDVGGAEPGMRRARGPRNYFRPSQHAGGGAGGNTGHYLCYL